MTQDEIDRLARKNEDWLNLVYADEMRRELEAIEEEEREIEAAINLMVN